LREWLSLRGGGALSKTAWFFPSGDRAGPPGACPGGKGPNLDKNPAFRYIFSHETALQIDLPGRVTLSPEKRFPINQKHSSSETITYTVFKYLGGSVGGSFQFPSVQKGSVLMKWTRNDQYTYKVINKM